jgi:hypothetical protein
MASPRPKRHHYVPQFHLAGFVEPQTDRRSESVWLADVKERTVRLTTTRNVALERLFYDWNETSWWKESGEPPQLEEFFSQIEQRAAPVFRRFASMNLANLRLSNEDRYHISNYIGLQATRTPFALDIAGASQSAVIDRRIQELADDPTFDDQYSRWVEGRSNEATFPSPEVARARMKESPPRLVPNRDRSLALCVNLGIEIAERVCGLPWSCLIAPRPMFFVSDHPVFIYSHDSSAETIEISMALSSRVRLVAHGKPRVAGKGNVIYLNDRGAEVCNRAILRAVRRFFFCPTQALAEWAIANHTEASAASVLGALDSLATGT